MMDNKHDTRSSIVLRKAEEGDCHDVWLWRNHQCVRKWCVNSQEIPYEEHCVWFKKSISDVNTAFYIAHNERSEKIGQVRFEINGDTARISVNLNPVFIGQKLGNRLVRLATDLFMHDYPGKAITAEILDNNIGSIRSFQKAGYIFSHHMVSNNKRMDVYMMQR